MQLTAKLALLAAFVYSAPRALALPIAGNSESIVARDVQYDLDARDFADFDLDAREFDELKFAARDLISQYYEAREFFDELDARSNEELSNEAREFEEFFYARATGKELSPQILADIKAILANAELKTHVAQDANLKDLLLWLDMEIKDKDYWKTVPGLGPSYGGDDSTPTWKQARKTRLDKIKSFKKGDDIKKLDADIKAEKAELARRHTPYSKNGLSLDPNLAAVLRNPSSQPMFNSFALAKNEVLSLLERISVDTKNPYHQKAVDELAKKKLHNDSLSRSDAAAVAKSKLWKADLESIKRNQDPKKLVSGARDHVRRLRTILANKNTSKPYQDAVAAEDKYREQMAQMDKTITAGAAVTPAPPAGQQPIAGAPTVPKPAQRQNRRRRVNNY